MATRKKVGCREGREDQGGNTDPESEKVGMDTVVLVHREKMRPPVVTERTWVCLLLAVVWSFGTSEASR